MDWKFFMWTTQMEVLVLCTKPTMQSRSSRLPKSFHGTGVSAGQNGHLTLSCSRNLCRTYSVVKMPVCRQSTTKYHVRAGLTEFIGTRIIGIAVDCMGFNILWQLVFPRKGRPSCTVVS